LPPIRIHVGDDEVLLDDSLRYGERAIAAGVDARVDVWMGLAHGFVVNVGRLKAAGAALDDVGAFVYRYSLENRLVMAPMRAAELCGIFPLQFRPYTDNIIHFLKKVAMTGGLLQVVGFGAGALSIDNRR
jgi:uncharacterized membrane protein YphA (DoxX/SURF4 family)